MSINNTWLSIVIDLFSPRNKISNRNRMQSNINLLNALELKWLKVDINGSLRDFFKKICQYFSSITSRFTLVFVFHLISIVSQSEVEDIVKRLQAHKGVQGIIIVNQDG